MAALCHPQLFKGIILDAPAIQASPDTATPLKVRLRCDTCELTKDEIHSFYFPLNRVKMLITVFDAQNSFLANQFSAPIFDKPCKIEV